MHSTKPHSHRLAVVFLTAILVSLVCPDRHTGTLHCQTLMLRQQLTGHENHFITLADATALTMNFKMSVSAGTITGEYFGKDAIQAVLNQPNVVGLRIYYGRKNNGTPALVVVGVDANAKDLLVGPLLEDGFPCPPICDTSRVH